MFGKGILKGLAVTAKNLVGSYTDKERLVTVQYPEEKRPQFENTREFPFLVYDDNDPVNGLRCVACQICEKECPPQCIYIVKKSRKKEDGKIRYYPEVFDIDYSVCMSCQICVEVCPFDAIKMDVVFENAATDRFEGLLMGLDKLSKPNEYFHKIHPTEAKQSDTRVKGG
ncbi:MAG: 4Fe-4S dicluster domain-containing protein [Verrucomicrobiia bacterium]